jgi:hypothetical protein
MRMMVNRKGKIMKRYLIWLICPFLFALIAMYVLLSGCSSSTGPDDAVTPEIVSIYPERGQTGTLVKIRGSNFGRTEDSVKFGDVPAPILSWRDTLIKTEVPQGAMPGVIYVKKGGRISNKIPFMVENLKITSVSPSRLFPGSDISIHGYNFGESSGTVLIDCIDAIVSSWSDTLIIAIIPDECSLGEIEVRSGELVSNIVRIGIYTIAIDSIEPSIAFVGEEVKLFGNFYHVTDGCVKFNGVIADIIFQSDTLIVAIVPDGAISGDVVIEANGYLSNGVYFRVRNMIITALKPSSGLPGDLVVILGWDFGDEIGIVTLSGVEAEILSWSDSLILAKIPDATSSGDVMVMVHGYYSNGVYFFVGQMTIISLEPSKGLPGSHLSINGYGFGDEHGIVLFGGIDAEIQLWSDTLITAIVPQEATSGQVVVESNGFFSNGIFFHVRELTISSIEPSSDFVGSSITIHGYDFGEEQGFVRFAGNDALIVEWLDTLILSIVPEGASSGNVVVEVDGHYSNGMYFHVRQMTITNLEPAIGLPGDVIMIYGYDFGSAPGTVTFAGIVADVQSWSDTLIDVIVPEIVTGGDVVVEFEGHYSNGMYFIVADSNDLVQLLNQTNSVTIAFKGFNTYISTTSPGAGLEAMGIDTILAYGEIGISSSKWPDKYLKWNGRLFSIKYNLVNEEPEFERVTLDIRGYLSANGEEITSMSASYDEISGTFFDQGSLRKELSVRYLPLDSIIDLDQGILFSFSGPEVEYIVYKRVMYSSRDIAEYGDYSRYEYLSTDWQNIEYPPEITVIFRKE